MDDTVAAMKQTMARAEAVMKMDIASNALATEGSQMPSMVPTQTGDYRSLYTIRIPGILYVTSVEDARSNQWTFHGLKPTGGSRLFIEEELFMFWEHRYLKIPTLSLRICSTDADNLLFPNVDVI